MILTVSGQTVSSHSVSYPTPSIDPFGLLGSSIAVDGDVAVVAANTSNKNGTRSGQAFVYKKIDDEWVQVAELLPTEYQDRGQFGTAVDIEDDVIVVSATWHTVTKDLEGVVFVYERSGSEWTTMAPTAVLTNSDLSDRVQMGHQLKIEGNVVIASSIRTQKVYVYEKSSGSWADMTETAELSASWKGVVSEFGFSIDITDDLIAVGTSYTNEPGASRGVVYVFNKEGAFWQTSSESSMLFGDPEEDYFRFGKDVKISSNTLFVATGNSRVNLSGPPIVYVFKLSAEMVFEPLAKLSITDNHSASFSEHVSVFVESDKVFLSTTSYQLNGIPIGGVFAFQKETSEWESKTQDHVYISNNPMQMRESFGFSISGNSSELLIGNVGNRRDGNSGAVHVFSQDFQNEPSEKQTFTSTYPSTSFYNYGRSVAVSGEYALVESPGDNELNPRSGAIYVLNLQGTDWITIAKLTSPAEGQPMNYGSDIAIYGNTIAIGESNNESFTEDGGVVYLYSIDGDTVLNDEYTVLSPSSPEQYHEFGSSISLNESGIAIGAYVNSENFKKGRIVVFEKSDIVTSQFSQKAVLRVNNSSDYDTQFTEVTRCAN